MGGLDSTPHKVFLSFSKRIKPQHLTFSVAVRSSLAHILRQIIVGQLLWLRDMTSQVAVGQAVLGENTCFQLLSTSKVNLVAKIMQSVYLCAIFHYKHEMAAKMATIFADVTGLQQRHQP